jgi:hypothetical protein
MQYLPSSVGRRHGADFRNHLMRGCVIRHVH